MENAAEEIAVTTQQLAAANASVEGLVDLPADVAAKIEAGNEEARQVAADPTALNELREKIEAMRKESVMENKQLRVDMDKCLQILKGHDKPTRASQERSIAMRKLQEAIMWLGMDNKALHEQNPYPNSMDPSNAKVEPTADGLKM